MSNDKLRECPFCGSKVDFETVDKSNYDDYEDRHFISCPECPDVEFESRDKDCLIATWNTRYTPKHETVEECINCHGTGYYFQKNPDCSICDAFCEGSVQNLCVVKSKCYECNGKPEVEE